LTPAIVLFITHIFSGVAKSVRLLDILLQPGDVSLVRQTQNRRSILGD
jgi:hypothetical protein